MATIRIYEMECGLCPQVYRGRTEDEAEQKLMAHEVAEHKDGDEDPEDIDA